MILKPKPPVSPVVEPDPPTTFSPLESDFFAAGTALEKGEVTPADDELAEPPAAPGRRAWLRAPGLAVGAACALLLGVALYF
jgi:hypothetical protein